MELIKINKTSKSKVGGKNYHYNPIVKKDGKYFVCKTVLSPVVLDKKEVNISTLVIWFEIKPEFYEANGLPKIETVLTELKEGVTYNVKVPEYQAKLGVMRRITNLDNNLVFGVLVETINAAGRIIKDRLDIIEVIDRKYIIS